MAMNNLKDLYVDQLRDLYSAENQLLVALPKLADAASDTELKSKFRKHEKETRQHADRLLKIFEDLGETATGHHCRGMEGLIYEGEELLQKRGTVDGAVLDAALIATAQRVEHYEIAGYGCVRTYAKMLGMKDHEKILQQTLDEEGKTDHTLTDVAEDRVNKEARA